MSVKFLDRIDLGTSLEFYKTLQNVGKLGDDSCNERYGELYNALESPFGDATDADVTPAWLAKVAQQADAFLAEFKGKLNHHDWWVIKQLTSACKRNVRSIKTSAKSKTKKRK